MKRFIIGTIAIFVSLSLRAFSGSGAGTEKDPYLVTNADELFEIRNEPYATYLQTNDIDLTEWITDNNPLQGWIPISDFAGTYDGAHHIIKGLMINRKSSNNIGLFGSLATDVNVILKNICLINPKITGNDNVGGIVGCVISTYKNKEIKNNSIFGGEISAQNGIAGGIIGSAHYNVTGIYNNENELNIVGNSVFCLVQGNIVGVICAQAQGSSANYQSFYVVINDNLFNGKVNAYKYGGGIVGVIPECGVKVYRNVASGILHSNETVSGITNRFHANTIRDNISIADTISANKELYRICNEDDGNTFDNYARINTVTLINGKNVEIEDNSKNGIAVGDKTLMRQTTYQGHGFDFSTQWCIEEGVTFPFEIYQSKKPTVKSFFAGSKAILSGEASTNNGKIYSIINGLLFETNVIDKKWEINVGNIRPNTMCILTLTDNNKSFSTPVITYSQKNSSDGDIVCGDANSDGSVDAADVVSIINYIIGKASSSFNEKNADSNSDGQILIDDAVGTVNIIINKQ